MVTRMINYLEDESNIIRSWMYVVQLYCIVFIHFYSIELLTTGAFRKRSRPQQLTLCRSLHAEVPQATVSEGLAQGGG